MMYTPRTISTSKLTLVMAVSLILTGCGPDAESQATVTHSSPPLTGALADIVVPDTHDSLLAGANGVNLSTSLSVADLTAFFEDQMPTKGWTLTTPVVPKPGSAVMYFEQGGRSATVHIRRPPAGEDTQVQIILS